MLIKEKNELKKKKISKKDKQLQMKNQNLLAK